MEEIQTGVEQVPVAEGQAETNVEAVGDVQTQETTQTTTEEQNASPRATEAAETIQNEKDFAAALRARERQLQEKYEKEYNSYKQYASQVERMAKDLGYRSADEYLAALDELVRRQKAEAEAQRMGIDPETYNQFFAPVYEELNKYKQELEQLRMSDLQRQIKADYERLKAQYDDFEAIQDKVFDVAEQRGLPLEDAYKLVAFDEKVKAAKLAGQQEALQKLKQNAQTSTGAAGGDAPEQTFDFTKLPPEKRAEYYEKAIRGELKSLH